MNVAMQKHIYNYDNTDLGYRTALRWFTSRFREVSINLMNN